LNSLVKQGDLNSGITNGTNHLRDWANRFQDIVETGDINAKLRPKFDLKQPKDGIKFKKFLYDTVEKYQIQKYVKNKNFSIKDLQMKTFLAKITQNETNEDDGFELN
jgi:hypothetical protein